MGLVKLEPSVMEAGVRREGWGRGRHQSAAMSGERQNRPARPPQGMDTCDRPRGDKLGALQLPWLREMPGRVRTM